MKKLLVCAAVVASLALAACSGPDDDTTTPDASAPTSPPSASASSSASGPRPSAGDDSSGAPASASPTSGGRLASCATEDLRVSVRAGQGGGAAGSSYRDVVLRNAGTSSCAMTGWPGVSYVTGGSGRQVGAAADRTGSPAVVRLAAGQSATAQLKIARAENFQNCRSTGVRGLRIYAPNQKDAVFVASAGRACSSADAHQLTVQPVRAAG